VRDKNVNGVGVGAALHPVHGYREELLRKGVKPKDHFRENIVEMRRKQKEAHEQREREREEREAAEKFKLKRFADVGSKVRELVRAARRRGCCCTLVLDGTCFAVQLAVLFIVHAEHAATRACVRPGVRSTRCAVSTAGRCRRSAMPTAWPAAHSCARTRVYQWPRS
jgi:hypothetical protein